MKTRDYKAVLEFSDRWFELGLLTEDKLDALGREFDTSDDKNTEHYRYATFRSFLASHQPLSPSEAEALYELGEQDPDPCMGGAMMHDIVDLPECPASVLHRAAGSGQNHLVQLVRRKELLSELDAGLTPDVFMRCLSSRDSTVQRELLTRWELSQEQLECLSQAGSNRAIRNMAAVQLRPRTKTRAAPDL